jgi:hypothetical protein
MNKNEKNSKRAAPGKRTLAMLVIMFCLCCIALVPAVAAIYPADKWITDNRTVYVNDSPYATIDGKSFTNAYFFGITGNSHFNTTPEAWNWTKDPNPLYDDRYYLEQLKVDNGTVEAWYPPQMQNLQWQWEFVSSLEADAKIYKKGLGWYIDDWEDKPHYIWYGNKSASYIYHPPYTNWLDPSYENATYVVALPVQWVT